MAKLRTDAVYATSRPPPADAWDTIEHRVARGDSVILPTPDRSAARGEVSGGVRRVIAIVAAVAAVFLVVRTDSAAGSRSELKFEPAAPTADADVRVEFRSTSFPGADSVRLRVRFRDADLVPGSFRSPGEFEVSVEVALTPAGGGVFRGRLRIPTAAVYGAAIVESTDGGTIDDNLGRLWDIRVHAGDGRPLYDALAQEAEELSVRDWPRGHQVARELVSQYPDRPGAWHRLLSFDQQLPASVDSARRRHTAELTRLHGVLRSRDARSSRALVEIFYYAWAVSGDAISRDRPRDSLVAYWEREILRKAPGDIGEAHVQLLLRMIYLYDDPGTSLAVLEDYWRRWGEIGDPWAVGEGIRAARAAGDDDGLRRWLLRYGAGSPADMVSALSALSGTEQHGPEAIERLRALRRETASAPHKTIPRPLLATSERHSAAVAGLLARIDVALGRALVGEPGDAALEGIALLRAVAERSAWDPDLLEDVGRGLIAAGDTAGGLPYVIDASVDPMSRNETGEGVRQEFAGLISEEVWDARRRAATGRMRAAIEADLIGEPIDDDGVRVSYADGRDVAVMRDFVGRVAVVTFWSEFCGPSLAQLPRTRELAGQLEARGVRYVIVTERDTPRARQLLEEHGLSDIAAFDRAGRLGRQLGRSATPQHILVDREGFVRLRQTGSFAPVVRAASVLAATTDR